MNSFFSANTIGARDVFAREASIVNEVPHKRRFFVSDKCKFDIIESKLRDVSLNEKQKR